MTIDGMTDLSCSDDVSARFRAYGWNVVQLGDCADDMDALERALNEARAHVGAPTLIVLRTHIGTPSPDFTDKPEAHGNPFTAAHVTATKNAMGIPDQPFWTDAACVAAIREHARTRGAALSSAHDKAAAKAGSEWSLAWQPMRSDDWAGTPPAFEPGAAIATRVAVQKAIDASRDDLPGLVVGAADLTGNTGAKMSGAQRCRLRTPRVADLLRRARACDGCDRRRHGAARRNIAGSRHLLRLRRLHASGDTARCAVAREGGVRLLARLRRSRRRRPDPPASSNSRRCA